MFLVFLPELYQPFGSKSSLRLTRNQGMFFFEGQRSLATGKRDAGENQRAAEGVVCWYWSKKEDLVSESFFGITNCIVSYLFKHIN